MKVATEPTAQDAGGTRPERTLTGYPLSPGVAIGLVFLYEDLLHQQQHVARIDPDAIDSETERLNEALHQVEGDLTRHAEIVANELNDDAADVFLAHLAILQDDTFQSRIEEVLREQRVNVETAVRIACRRLREQFRRSESTVVSTRAADVSDLARRLLRRLSGQEAHQLESVPPNSVIVATVLHPSDTVFLARQRVAGIAVEHAGATSHTALLTREAGLPAVGGVDGLTEWAEPGAEVMVNGFDGTVVFRPSPKLRAAGRRKQQDHLDRLRQARSNCREPAIRPDGTIIPVLANVSRAEDALLAVENGADGIGLFRTEHLLLRRRTLPAVDELAAELDDLLKPFRGRSVTVRLLDSGGDKKMSYLDYPEEENPMLGLRGVRLLRRHPDLLRTQLRAVLQLVDDYDLRLLVPLVTVVEDMEFVRRELQQVTAECGLPAEPPVGAMIEVPAAAVGVAALAPHCDFLSVGTNDLVQYTMAAGRENEEVLDYYREDHPVIWRLLASICEHAGELDVEVCGDMAANTELVEGLLDAGVAALSVPPLRIPLIKQEIRCNHHSRKNGSGA